MKPAKKSGVLGFPLKTAMIQEPMIGNTLSIEAKLLTVKRRKYFKL